MIRACDINWDTDGEEVDLPEEVEIQEEDLLYETERPEDVDREELHDRIADYLSDKYEFCVFDFYVEDSELCQL